MGALVDFCLTGGETSNSLIMVIQDIETVMTSGPLELITDADAYIDLDQYLFKHGVNTSQVSLSIKQLLATTVTNPLSYDFDVKVTLLDSQQVRDMLLVQIAIIGENIQQTMLEFLVSKNLQATKLP